MEITFPLTRLGMLEYWNHGLTEHKTSGKQNDFEPVIPSLHNSSFRQKNYITYEPAFQLTKKPDLDNNQIPCLPAGRQAPLFK
jgi:hypothetical protein